jgi:hypothetical protein
VFAKKHVWKSKKKRMRKHRVEKTTESDGFSTASYDSELDSWWRKEKHHRWRRTRLPKITNKSLTTFDLEKDCWDEWKAKTV